MGYSVNDSVGVVFSVISTVINLMGNALSIALYILGSLGLYSIAKRRKLNRPWLAWVPLGNAWIVGSLSDQYRYVKHGQIKNKRKILLIFDCATVVVIVAAVVLLFVIVAGLETGTVGGGETAAAVGGIAAFLWMLLLWLGVIAVFIVRAVIRYMAMYDIYTSLDPAYSLVYLLISIFVSVTEPFFVFFNRKKDLGMPPRKDAPPVYVEEA